MIQSKLIAEKIKRGIIFRLYSNRVFHVIVPQHERIGNDIIQFGYRFLDENGGGKFFNIFQFHSFSDVEPEVREWAADNNGNHYTHTDAIVIGNWSQKIITDFYLKFNKPSKPTKIFYVLDLAIDWTEDQISLADQSDI